MHVHSIIGCNVAIVLSNYLLHHIRGQINMKPSEFCIPLDWHSNRLTVKHSLTCQLDQVNQYIDREPCSTGHLMCPVCDVCRTYALCGTIAAILDVTHSYFSAYRWPVH